MLTTYHLEDGRLVIGANPPDVQPADAAAGDMTGDVTTARPLHAALWYDLLHPTPQELDGLSRALSLDLPTRDEMEEIELSSRLYVENGATFLTVSALSSVDTADPVLAPVTFVLTSDAVVTIRYHEPRALATFTQRAQRVNMECDTPDRLLISLLEAMIERIADILERESTGLDAIAKRIFRKNATSPRGGVDLGGILTAIGTHGELNSKLQESLVTFDRITGFLAQVSLGWARPKTQRARIKTLSRDVRSLTDHAGFQAGKITFLLDATLGLVSIQQNGIIKIFSVAAVVFLPPTMIASIYGMNFEVMPELSWPWGYPFAISLMVLSAVLPYLFFKRRGWL
ncbi:magnesium transporter [Meridianimarinicoccus roseus]|uniref:Magnesium transport protein CorA n=1 Tax=Meridianimarinicoccus roseus TaxID=2072018 RepID=A0A2V2LEF0_9RHOB|nr:magnesium transporter CorA family protein [Meridianimarinicoccus roseus]PWR03958.1 magnesium transporter [Meridianimarinicoccus roseus]